MPGLVNTVPNFRGRGRGLAASRLPEPGADAEHVELYDRLVGGRDVVRVTANGRDTIYLFPIRRDDSSAASLSRSDEPGQFQVNATLRTVYTMRNELTGEVVSFFGPGTLKVVSPPAVEMDPPIRMAFVDQTQTAPAASSRGRRGRTSARSASTRGGRR